MFGPTTYWRRFQGLLTVLLFLAAIAITPSVQAAENPQPVKQSFRWSNFLKSVAGFVGGGVLAAALGAGGLVTVVAAVGGAIVAPYLFKKVRELVRKTFGQDHQVEFQVAPETQEDKARIYIETVKARAAAFARSVPVKLPKIGRNKEEPTASGVGESPELIMKRYEKAYKAYLQAVQDGDPAGAKKHLREYRKYQAAKQGLLK